jgi:hypothetical protein
VVVMCGARAVADHGGVAALGGATMGRRTRGATADVAASTAGGGPSGPYLGWRAPVCVGSGRPPFALAWPCGTQMHACTFRLPLAARSPLQRFLLDIITVVAAWVTFDLPALFRWI